MKTLALILCLSLFWSLTACQDKETLDSYAENQTVTEESVAETKEETKEESSGEETVPEDSEEAPVEEEGFLDDELHVPTDDSSSDGDFNYYGVEEDYGGDGEPEFDASSEEEDTSDHPYLDEDLPVEEMNPGDFESEEW